MYVGVVRTKESEKKTNRVETRREMVGLIVIWARQSSAYCTKADISLKLRIRPFEDHDTMKKLGNVKKKKKKIEQLKFQTIR